MRAQVLNDFGNVDQFQMQDVADPQPGPNQVLVRLQATSINPVDTKLRTGGRAMAPDLPAVLGCDVSGVVTAVGENVEDLKVGDGVYGAAGGVQGHGGAYAEFIAADARFLAKRPKSLTPRQAAALPLVTITAWEGLNRAGLQEGQKILVRGGTGGVGHVIIQLAKARGAFVATTVSSADKARLAKDLGADATINYREDDVAKETAALTDNVGFDVIFDATGGDDLEGALELAKPNGQVVTIVSTYEADLTQMHLKGLSLHVVFMLIPLLHGTGGNVHKDILTQAAELVQNDQLRPLIDPAKYTLDQIPDAHRQLESGKTLGKIVVDISG